MFKRPRDDACVTHHRQLAARLTKHVYRKIAELPSDVKQAEDALAAPAHA